MHITIIHVQNGAALKGHSLERKALQTCQKGNKFLAASTRIPCDAPFTLGQLSNKGRIAWQKRCPYQRRTTVCLPQLQPSWVFITHTTGMRDYIFHLTHLNSLCVKVLHDPDFGGYSLCRKHCGSNRNTGDPLLLRTIDTAHPSHLSPVQFHRWCTTDSISDGYGELKIKVKIKDKRFT